MSPQGHHSKDTDSQKTRMAPNMSQKVFMSLAKEPSSVVEVVMLIAGFTVGVSKVVVYECSGR